MTVSSRAKIQDAVRCREMKGEMKCGDIDSAGRVEIDGG